MTFFDSAYHHKLENQNGAHGYGTSVSTKAAVV